MDSNVRRAALLAALKVTQTASSPALRDALLRKATNSALLRSTVALGLAGAFVGGCALEHAAPRPTDAPETDALADAAAGADALDAATPDVPVDCEEYLASLDIIHAGTEDWPTGQFSEAARNDLTTGACCHQMELDAQAGLLVTEWPPTPLAYACCDVVVFAQNLEPFSELGCTPWGPPCPPAMPA